jgi:hypothetical protein
MMPSKIDPACCPRCRRRFNIIEEIEYHMTKYPFIEEIKQDTIQEIRDKKRERVEQGLDICQICQIEIGEDSNDSSE